ncbi:MAG: amylo-alpha-1,6-glucosidase [Thermoplasmataceae archaeon]
MIPGEEWIITNRNGSYASSTGSLANTRSYHGILVRNVDDRFLRKVLVNKIFEVVTTDSGEVSLDTNYYGDVVFPDGYRSLRKFSDFPVPTFSYSTGSIEVRKEIAIHPLADQVSIRYTFSGARLTRIRIIPLISFRSYHETISEGTRTYKTTRNGHTVSVENEELSVSFDSVGEFLETGRWYRNFLYPVERERGTIFREDLYEPGEFQFNNPGKSLEFRIYSGTHVDIPFHDVRKAMENDIRKNGVYPAGLGQIPLRSAMLLTRDNIIAGYHWFGPWARDAFISMPGLMLVTGRYREAANLLYAYRKVSRKGAVPKRLETPEDFRTADSGLLYIYAAWKYLQYTGDLKTARDLFPFLNDIAMNYIRGNNMYSMDGPFIRVTDAPLTWMDAERDGIVFTPRKGDPVEINALWYNALRSLEDISSRINADLPVELNGMADLVMDEFSAAFVKGKTVLDVARPDDMRLRPNFIMAFSLPFPVLSGFGKFKNAVDERLLTRYGIRTLDPGDPNYKGHYTGDFPSRDAAYHNGTVWPWLIGPYITASRRSGYAPDRLMEYFRPLLSMPYLPEIFDGDPDGAPKGCMMQAWSYGEIMRSYHEDVINPGGMFD